MNAESKVRLRLWLRLLRATRAIEVRVRERLRVEHGATLPRFDVLATLARAEEGLILSELSERLMVSNGNLTGIVDRLEADGLIDRRRRNGDRRTSFVSLSEEGQAVFERMAAEHERWIDELLADVEAEEAERLSTRLDGLLAQVEAHS
ncbi:MAG: MarR family transcriptional regulator [Myxococcota bacterium]